MTVLTEAQIIRGPQHARFSSRVPHEVRNQLKAALISCVMNVEPVAGIFFGIRVYDASGAPWLAIDSGMSWVIGPNDPEWSA